MLSPTTFIKLLGFCLALTAGGLLLANRHVHAANFMLAAGVLMVAAVTIVQWWDRK